jgi:hypothetical protein
MYTKTVLSVFLFGTLFTFAQVGIGTTNPDPGSVLDIKSTDKGILIPRVALTATNSQLPITPAAVEGMMVYNTATAGTSPNIVTPGFYFWDGTLWMRVATGGTVTKDWTIAGNGDTNATTDFIGTTNNQDLRFKTNDFDRFTITTGDATTGGRLMSNNDGSVALPTYSFINQPNMGMFRQGNNDIRFAANGAPALQLTNNSLRSFFNHRFANGTAAAPSIAYQSNTGTGFFRPGANILGISTAGVERMRIDENGNVGINTNAPAYKFHVSNNGTDIGATSLATSVNSGASGVALFGLNTGTSNGFNGIEGGTNYNSNTFSPSGVFGLASATTGNAIGVRGVANSSNGYGVYGSIPTTGTWLGYGGVFFGGLGYANGIYNLSDERAKKNITKISSALDNIMKIDGVSYNYDMKKYNPNASEDPHRYYGFLAQNIKEYLPFAVAEKNVPFNDSVKDNNSSSTDHTQLLNVVDYTAIIPVLVEAMKEQQKLIENQESRIAKLESLVHQLINQK